MVATYLEYIRERASRIVRYKADGVECELAIFDPPSVSPVDGTVFTGARPVAIHEAGGARRKRPDYNIGSSATAQMFNDELGAYVVIAGVTQGGLDDGDSEEFEMLNAPESVIESALVVMFLKGNATDPRVCGDTFTMQTSSRYYCHWGDSSGAWHGMMAQLVPAGDFAYLASEAAQRGSDYKYHPDHTVSFLYEFEPQNRISNFCESVVDTAAATVGDADFGGEGTYVVDSDAAAGATTVALSGDTAKLYRANRLRIDTETTYLTNGSIADGANSIPVDTGTAAIPVGCYIKFDTTDSNWHLVSEDYAGGAGNIRIVGDAVDSDTPGTPIPDNTMIHVRFTYAVTADFTSGSVSIKPSVQYPITASSSAVAIERIAGEALGIDEKSWAGGGYGFTGNSGFVWRSDHHSGRGFPLARKRQMDVDYMVRSDNPRAKEINLLIVAPASTTILRSDILTGERSFWINRNLEIEGLSVAEYVDPTYVDLHDGANSSLLARKLYLLGNQNVTIYVGTRFDNPLGTSEDIPELAGRYSTFSNAILKAYLTNANRQGGSFA